MPTGSGPQQAGSPDAVWGDLRSPPCCRGEGSDSTRNSGRRGLGIYWILRLVAFPPGSLLVAFFFRIHANEGSAPGVMAHNGKTAFERALGEFGLSELKINYFDGVIGYVVPGSSRRRHTPPVKGLWRSGPVCEQTARACPPPVSDFDGHICYDIDGSELYEFDLGEEVLEPIGASTSST